MTPRREKPLSSTCVNNSKRGGKSLVGNKDYRRLLKDEGKDHFAVDENLVKGDARFAAL